MAGILIDKSWVQGGSAGTLASVSAEHDLLMPEALFYELLTTRRDEQILCFARLSKVQNSIRLLCGIPDLLRYESESGKPATPLANRCIANSISFHPTAGTTGYSFTEQHVETIEAERASREGTGLQELQRVSSVVSGWFPALKGLPANSQRDRIQPYLQRVATDVDMVRDIFGAIRSPGMPEPAALDDRWAFFRYVQVRLVGALEYIRRYGDRNEAATGKKIPNFFLDQDYLIPALLADGLASCDAEMLEFYQLLAPQKTRIGRE
jgi:hypothetical protein